MYELLKTNLDKFKQYKKFNTSDGYTLVVFYLKTTKDTVYMLRTVGENEICATNIFFFIKNKEVYFVREEDKKFIDDISLVWFGGIDTYKGTGIYRHAKFQPNDINTDFIFNIHEMVYIYVNDKKSQVVKDMLLSKVLLVNRTLTPKNNDIVYVIKVYTDGDAIIPTRICLTGSGVSIIVTTVDELYNELFNLIENFKGGKLDNCFYRAFDGLGGPLRLEEGNYWLEISSIKESNVKDVTNAFSLISTVI